MHIAYVLDTYPSLSETFIAREIAALRRAGFTITIFAIHAGEGAHAIPLPPILRAARKMPVAQRARTHWWRAIGARWWEDLEIKGIGHIHGGFASYPAALAWGAAEAGGLPWSFSGHARDIWVEGDDLVAKLAAASFATACTRAGARQLQVLNPQSEVLFAPHGLPLEEYAFQPSRSCGQVAHLVSVGRLVEKKGFPLLLEALAQLRRRCFPFTMTIIGGGPLKAELQREIGRLRLDGCVRLAGALSQEETKSRIGQADALVFSGLAARDGDRDGLPNVLLEAAALGTRIIATRVGGVEDFATSENAILCAPGDAGSLCEAVREAFAFETDAAQRTRAARARVEQDYNLACNIEPLAQAFLEAR